MFGKFIKELVIIIYILGLVGCGPGVEVGYQPPIVIPIRVSINSRGEINIGYSGTYVTSIGTFDVSAGTTIDLIRDEHASQILIIRVDNEAVVYELEEGNEFKVNFDDSNTLYKRVALEYESNGDIVLELESVSNIDGGLSGSNSETDAVPLSSNYWCDDLSYVKLSVGVGASVAWPKVNLRSAPIVPNDFYENIVAELEEGTSLTIIGGPECSHEGTWWEVQAQNGQTGWMRERVSDGYLMK